MTLPRPVICCCRNESIPVSTKRGEFNYCGANFGCCHRLLRTKHQQFFCKADSDRRRRQLRVRPQTPPGRAAPCGFLATEMNDTLNRPSAVPAI